MTSTLRQFLCDQTYIHPTAAWYLSDIGEFRGKHELFTRQSPQRLQTLREHALVESVVSSNRIEGVTVEPSRIREVLATPRPLFRDRDEEEIRGYRDALTWIHKEYTTIPISEVTIKHLHATTRGQIWDTGQYKEKDGDIIERYADGHERVRFRTVSASNTPHAMNNLVKDWQLCLEEGWVHPIIALAIFNLDFLCIHPFRDGNGRVSRLLWLVQSYQIGYEVGKYISLERLVEQNKERYYETLEQSSKNWHEGKHDPWPYINYVLFILKTAYKEFSERVGDVKSPRGTKRDQVIQSIDQLLLRSNACFTISELEQNCLEVSRDMVRRVLREQQAAGKVTCQGRGPASIWVKG
jgi:Fic family protein